MCSKHVEAYNKSYYKSRICALSWLITTIAIIIQQDATEYSLFKSVNCSTCFGWYLTNHQEFIALYLRYYELLMMAEIPPETC